ncbi:MAG: hypothetical protein KDA85_15305, partial [Planctomycetaceae bacterium]|nr:hypothetical protein [Planctomycetaceae bacterium]
MDGNDFGPSPDHNPFAAPRQTQITAVNPMGLTGHVKVIGILMMVQGGLVAFMGLGMFAVAAFMFYMFQELAQQQNANPNAFGGPGPPSGFEWFIPAMYSLMGVFLIGLAVMSIHAGARMTRFQS